MASASLICLMARTTSTKSWLWHQRLSHLNFDTINDQSSNTIKNIFVPHVSKEKSKRASHPPKPVPNSKQRALCYPKNDRKDIGKLGAKGDIGFFIAMDFKQSSLKPELQSMTYGQISSGLDLPYAPHRHATLKLFPLLKQPQRSSTPTATMTRQQTLTDTSKTHPLKQQVIQASTQKCDKQESTTDTTKDHPLEQVIREPSSPVLTKNQLRSNGDMCMYELTVSIMELKNVKEAMTDPAWIESMQEELLQFERLDVWVLVPAPDNIKPLTLKWLFKNKHDEENTVIRNKTRLVVRGYRKEEGIDFEESFAPVILVGSFQIIYGANAIQKS
ncbi:retrovirus-related pol polyprotein from transposon TNT 1-94 [Tanacetum coccineum]